MMAVSNVTPGYLFCLGAQKAGTTWLYDYLSRHPQVHVPPIKEVHYFNTMWLGKGRSAQKRKVALIREERAQARLRYRFKSWGRWAQRAMNLRFGADTPVQNFSPAVLDLLWSMYTRPDPSHTAYRRLMCLGRKREPYVADITPEYALLRKQQFARIAEDFPASKFLFLMRDPVARTWSGMNMFSRSSTAKAMEHFSMDVVLDGLEEGKFAHLLKLSRYQQTLFCLNNAVPRGRVLTLFYEDLFSDEALHSLCSFLEIDFVPGNYASVVHRGSEAKITADQKARLFELLRPVYELIERNYGDRVPDSWCKTSDWPAATVPNRRAKQLPLEAVAE